MTRGLATAIIAAILACTAPAAADAPDQNFSLTISPLHLFLPVVELTGELRTSDLIGVAVIGGFGSVEADLDGDPVNFDVLELGMQLIFYPLADFESLQLGAEMLYVQVTLQDGQISGEQVDVLGSGLFMGPLVGYKLLTDAGFTLFVQGGFGFLAIEAEAEDDSGQRATEKTSRVTPLLNFNLGWSF